MKKFCFIVSLIAIAAVARPTQSSAQQHKSSSGDNAFFLRTNLIQWATLTADLGFEYRYKDKYAFLLSGSTTPGTWVFKNGMRWGLQKFNAEVRYYMDENEPLYVGLGYQQGQANFYVPGPNVGRQGDFYAIGMTGGYILKLSKSWALDFNIGLGYAYFDYYQRYQRVTLETPTTTGGVPGVRTVKYFQLVDTKSKAVPTITQIGVNLVWKL